jgi:Pentapeptide repeats (8 copies)
MNFENPSRESKDTRSAEKKEAEEAQKIHRLYRSYGQPKPSDELTKQILGDQALHDEVLRLFPQFFLQGSFKSKKIDPATLERAAELGITNFSGVKLHYVSGEKYDDLSLREVELPEDVISVNFPNTDLTGADFTDTKLYGSNFTSTEMPHIEIQGRRIELWDRHLEVADDSMWDMHSINPADVGHCEDCERWNSLIMETPRKIRQNSSLMRRGILLFQEGAPLGYMKLKGDPSFLAIRTVVNEKQEVILWQGMVYALPGQLRISLEQQSVDFMNSKSWRKVDIERAKELPDIKEENFPIKRNNLRFIHDPKLYPLMTKLVDRIESGTEPIVDIMEKPGLDTDF